MGSLTPTTIISCEGDCGIETLVFETVLCKLKCLTNICVRLSNII